MKSFRCSLTFSSSLEVFNNTLLKFSRLPQTDPSVPFQLLEVKAIDFCYSGISLSAQTSSLIIYYCLTKQPITYWLTQQQSFTLFTSLQFGQGSVRTICLLPMPHQLGKVRAGRAASRISPQRAGKLVLSVGSFPHGLLHSIGVGSFTEWWLYSRKHGVSIISCRRGFISNSCLVVDSVWGLWKIYRSLKIMAPIFQETNGLYILKKLPFSYDPVLEMGTAFFVMKHSQSEKFKGWDI